MKRVTLIGIQRRGLANWKGREWWNRQKVRIWSREHGAYWRPNAAGYTDKIDKAGVYDFRDAFERVGHCGPEKRISFYSLSSGEGGSR